MNVKGTVYMLALAAVSASVANAGLGKASEVALWGSLSLGFLLASLFLLRNAKSAKIPSDQ